MTTNPAAAHTISHRLRNRLQDDDKSKIISTGWRLMRSGRLRNRLVRGA